MPFVLIGTNFLTIITSTPGFTAITNVGSNSVNNNVLFVLLLELTSLEASNALNLIAHVIEAFFGFKCCFVYRGLSFFDGLCTFQCIMISIPL